MRLRTDHSQLNAHMFKTMKLAPSPVCNCSLEDQTAEHLLQRCPLLQNSSKNKCVVNSSSATHQTLRQQGGTGEDGYIHLADWTLSEAAMEKKNQHFISTLLAQMILCHRLYSYNYFFSPFLCLSACSTKKVDTVKELSIIII